MDNLAKEITQFVGEYGLTLGIILWTILGLIRVIERLGPDIWGYLKSDLSDRRENKQKLLQETMKNESMQLLIAQGSRTFTEEQLTMMTSETQTQLSEANEFIRKDIAEKLDAIIQQLILLKDRVDRIPTVFGEKYREDFEENRRIRASIAMIAHVLDKEFGRKSERIRRRRTNKNVDTREQRRPNVRPDPPE